MAVNEREWRRPAAVNERAAGGLAAVSERVGSVPAARRQAASGQGPRRWRRCRGKPCLTARRWRRIWRRRRPSRARGAWHRGRRSTAPRRERRCQSEASRSNQKQSETIRSHQKHSEAIRSNLTCPEKRETIGIVCPCVARMSRPTLDSIISKRCLSLKRTTSRTSLSTQCLAVEEEEEAASTSEEDGALRSSVWERDAFSSFELT